MAVLRREYKFAEDYASPPFLAMKNGTDNSIDAHDIVHVAFLCQFLRQSDFTRF